MDYEGLISRIEATLRAEQRVQAAWLAGSRARNVEDEYSDVDVWLVVATDELEGFLADWPVVSDRIAPTVYRQRVGAAPVFNHITDEWLRFDIAVGTPDEVPKRTRTTLKPLFDRAGHNERLAPGGEPRAPDGARILALTTEFLRVLGLLPVVLGRKEYVVGASGAGLLRGMVIQLMLEDVAVEDRGGALHLGPLLPPERMRILRDLPPLAATRDSVLDAHLACARAFLPLARQLAERTGTAWPAELEAAARRRLQTTLGVAFDER